MKLPNFYVFDPLNRLKEKMGIALETVGSLDVLIDAARLTAFELEKLASQDGLDISLDDLDVLSDGLWLTKIAGFFSTLETWQSMGNTSQSLDIICRIVLRSSRCGRKNVLIADTLLRQTSMEHSI
jgi:hypothetical protein